MSMTPEKRRGKAQKAARARWHGDRAEVTPEITQLEADQVGQAVAVLKAAWRSRTSEQEDDLRRLIAPLAHGQGPAAG